MTKSDGGSEGRCSTCAFCLSPEMFARDPRPHVPMCGKYMWLLSGAEKTNCAGWADALLSARDEG